jgi:hypothetical protein
LVVRGQKFHCLLGIAAHHRISDGEMLVPDVAGWPFEPFNFSSHQDLR